eukprot:TRINITY_DN18725_c0_g2_i1.p1 TRINITY_DN18725_c0_g2~~TRINITY_DN18725_c0_g2_i1.p1  ORF type:complete len:513 (+),score=74.78 TRINITY_DN18725_c0_g2_i1:23-1540(+)
MCSRSALSVGRTDKVGIRARSSSRVTKPVSIRRGYIARPVCAEKEKKQFFAPSDMTGRSGREWFQTLINRFKPITDKAPNTAVLEFEKPLVELDKRIKEVRQVAEDNGVDVSEQVKELEERAQKLCLDTYSRLTPTQRLQVARHPNRPTFLDIVLNITDKFVELHGDRAGLDDPAMVCGIGSIDNRSIMFIGHQKGRNTKENIYRNFGMPQPNGYRKALRFMKHANKFGFPILTFIDTPGAYAGKVAEELGQGEAIAVNLREMFGLKVPIISLVIGEGGSGGALAIGCPNRSLIMENAVYYVASPEACAAILWKSREKAPAATEALKITANDLIKLGIMDEIVKEPLGGAHADPMASFPMIREALMRNLDSYVGMDGESIMMDRYTKFRNMGQYLEHDFGNTFENEQDVRKAEIELKEKTDQEEKEWQELVKDKTGWVHKPEALPTNNESLLREVEQLRRELSDKIQSGQQEEVEGEEEQEEEEEGGEGEEERTSSQFQHVVQNV